MDVVLVRWPDEAEKRGELAAGGRPRLLLVDAGTTPPMPDDCLEDWIRLPADEDDISLRLKLLDRRSCVHHAVLPDIDDDGVLRYGEGWVPLPPVEARLMGALIAGFGSVVSREQLARRGWPEGAPGRNALDVHVLRLRRRISTVGLLIKTVRSRGYLLEAETVARNGQRHA